MNEVPKSQNNNQNISRSNEEECHYIKINKKKINKYNRLGNKSDGVHKYVESDESGTEIYNKKGNKLYGLY